MSPAEKLRDALASYRAAVDSGDRERIHAARGEHLRVVGEILAARAAEPVEQPRSRR